MNHIINNTYGIHYRTQSMLFYYTTSSAHIKLNQMNRKVSYDDKVTSRFYNN